MKKYSTYIYLLLFFNILVVFSSCEKETSMEQNFRVGIPTEAPNVAYVGRELSFDVALEAASGLQRAEVRIDFQTLEGSEQADFANSTTGTYHFSYTPTQFDLGKKLSFVIVAYDNLGFTTTAKQEVTIEEAPVNINIQIPDDAPNTINPEEFFEFDIQVLSELDMQSITTSVNGIVIEGLTKANFDNPKLDSYHLAYTTNNDDAGMELIFTIQVTDVENKVKTAEYKLTVGGERVPKPVLVFKDIVFGAQKNTENGHFLNSATGSRYFSPGVAEISSTIDLVCFVSGSTGTNITAPIFANNPIVYSVAHSDAVNAIAAWPVRNDTKLKRLSEFSPQNFEAIEMDSEIMALFEAEEVEETDNINRIQADNIIVFKTVNDKYGIIRVKAPIPATNTGSLIFDYKIQK